MTFGKEQIAGGYEIKERNKYEVKRKTKCMKSDKKGEKFRVRGKNYLKEKSISNIEEK